MYRLIFGLILISIVEKSQSSVEYQDKRENYCSRLVNYDEDEIIPETRRILETYRAFCWYFTLTCTKQRYKTVTVNKTVTIKKTKRVYDCCPGYEKKGDFCFPLCRLGCGKGECVEPDTCLCEPGWREPFCLTECEPSKYGRGCKDNCTCFHGDCDKKTGLCDCTEGYTGDNCEFLCPINTYGQDCEKKCLCENDAICDAVNGTCECKPGYEGELCEKKCDLGIYGLYCDKLCICIPENTESCNHVDGKCHCKPGYRGDYCEKECADFSYGRNCNKECRCENSYFCDSVYGTCFCRPGWTGATCSEKCHEGMFGDNCSSECAECTRVWGGCDPVTGYCICPDGRYGKYCENVCPPGYWGFNCSSVCNCGEDVPCDALGGCRFAPDADVYAKDRNDDHMKYLSTKNIINITFGCMIATVLLAILLLAFGYLKKKCPAKSDGPSTFRRAHTFILRIKKPSYLPGTNISNPVYDQPEVVLDSGNNEIYSIRGSYSSGVKYYVNKGNDLNAEKKISNTDKPSVPEVNKNKESDAKGEGSRKFQLFGDNGPAYQETNRSSKHKMDYNYSSTVEEKDYQPEKLEDFNTFENIYEKPTFIESNNIVKKE